MFGAWKKSLVCCLDFSAVVVQFWGAKAKTLTRFSITRFTMKKTVVLTLATSALFLVGCCTSHQETAWNYKIIRGTIGGHSSSLPPLEQQLDQAAAEG
jgi:hypothetical protein